MAQRRPPKPSSPLAGTDDQDDRALLASYDPSAFERPSVTVDVALLTVEQGEIHTLLVKRDAAPQRGRWALPGGFVKLDESLDDAAARVLEAKAGVRSIFLEQLYTFGAPKRDPRMRVVTVAYYALVDAVRLREQLAEGGPQLCRVEVPWEGETGGAVDARGSGADALPLAFDHGTILGTAIKRVRGKIGYAPIGFQLLPERFSMSDLQDVHETILGRPLNKDSFRRKMLASGELEATGERQIAVDHRPGELYRFARRSAV